MLIGIAEMALYPFGIKRKKHLYKNLAFFVQMVTKSLLFMRK